MGVKNYFTDNELSCKCCDENKFNEDTLHKLNHFREALGFPFPVTSGYRCPAYNTKMGFTQTHSTGQAVDIAVSHSEAFQIVSLAAKFDFTGIGVKQKGAVRFIHLDDLGRKDNRPRPHIWSY